MLKLGTKVKDIVTGVSGILTSRHEYLNGCVRYALHPGTDKDGKIMEEVVFDQAQLELIDEGVSEKIKPSQTGGPTSQYKEKGI